jgi:mono/diheme cytochrome c family protein
MGFQACKALGLGYFWKQASMMPAPISAAPASAPPGGGKDARRPYRWAWGIILLGSLTSLPSFAADVPAVPLSSAPKLFETYCYDCHGDGSSKGKIALDEMLKTGGTNDYHANWDKAWKMVRREFMPPSTAKRPTDAERKAIAQWIEQKELGVDPAHPDPGRVTMRRLNRMEYEFTVTDLFGADLSAEQDFMSDTGVERLRLRDRLPPDDTAFGFDNNGDFLTMSPILLEKYFNVADYVVERVIFQDGPRLHEVSLQRTAMKPVRSEKRGTMNQIVEFDVAQSGQYRVELKFTAGNFAEILGTYDITVKADDQLVGQNQVEIGGHRTYKYENEVKLEKGSHKVVLTSEVAKPDANGTANYMESKPQLKITGPIGPQFLEYSDSHKRIFFQGEATGDPAQRRAYAKAILKRVADRAFRRPAEDATVEKLTEIVMGNGDFRHGVGQALTAILTSPRFLYRAETQPRPDDPKSIHPLDEYALASRLSYLFWLSLPDDELTQLASKKKLRENLDAQVRRVMADPKSARFFEDFPGQWLRTRNVLMTAISRADPLNPVRGSMKRETDMLFEHICRSDRDLLELVTADYTFVDRKLANYYGIDGVDGDAFQQVKLTAESKRGGILTQGSFLVSTSNPNRTSPVKRGVFVLENLLGSEPPPPPPNIPALDDAKAGGVTPHTVREQLAAHRDEKSCAACHAHFDPIGVVLENYDLIGRWRENDNGEKIDPRGSMITGENFASVDDLRKYFVEHKERFYRSATEKFLTYAIGRGLEPADSVTVDDVTAKLMADNGKFSTMLFGVLKSPAFQTRRGDDGQAVEAPRIAMPVAPPPERRTAMRRRGFFKADDAAQLNQNLPPVQNAVEGGDAKPPATIKPQNPDL